MYLSSRNLNSHISSNSSSIAKNQKKSLFGSNKMHIALGLPVHAPAGTDTVSKGKLVIT